MPRVRALRPARATSGVRASYLICTNPRSGSWLLAEGMRATGVAGRPEEYFNAFLRPVYLRDLGLRDDAPAEVVLQRMLDEGTTENGVFGAKLHRLQYAGLLDLLRDATGDRDADEISLLTRVFPALTLVHHDRLDGRSFSLIDCWVHPGFACEARGLRDLDSPMVVWSLGPTAGRTMERLAERVMAWLVAQNVLVLNASDGHADQCTRMRWWPS